MNSRVRQGITLVLVMATIVVNVLANSLPLNGLNTGEISDRFEIFFVPAGYVFSIWGLIYLGLIGFAIYQALPAQREDPLQKAVAPGVWIGSAANIAWIFFWHYEMFALTLPAMLILLASLLYVFTRISAARSSLDKAGRWLVEAVFAVYLGWISVATVANVTQVLFFYNWGGWGISDELWAVIMTAVATVLGILMLWRERSFPYAMVLVWAFIGIALKHGGMVGTGAYTGSAVLAAAAAVMLFTKPETGGV